MNEVTIYVSGTNLYGSSVSTYVAVSGNGNSGPADGERNEFGFSIQALAHVAVCCLVVGVRSRGCGCHAGLDSG
jgi:hypothetical protein